MIAEEYNSQDTTLQGQHALLLASFLGFLHHVLCDCSAGPHLIVCTGHSLHGRCTLKSLPCCLQKPDPALYNPSAVASWFDIGQNTEGTSAHVWHMN